MFHNLTYRLSRKLFRSSVNNLSYKLYKLWMYPRKVSSLNHRSSIYSRKLSSNQGNNWCNYWKVVLNNLGSFDDNWVLRKIRFEGLVNHLNIQCKLHILYMFGSPTNMVNMFYHHCLNKTIFTDTASHNFSLST